MITVEGGRRKSGSRKGVTSRERSFFDLRMEMLRKFADRKDCLLFTCSRLIPRILQESSKVFRRAGNATARYLTLIFTLFCITDVLCN